MGTARVKVKQPSERRSLTREIIGEKVRALQLTSRKTWRTSLRFGPVGAGSIGIISVLIFVNPGKISELSESFRVIIWSRSFKGASLVLPALVTQ